MVRVIKNNQKTVYYMIDTRKKHNINNIHGYYEKFNNKEEAQERADLCNLNGDRWYTRETHYTNRFIVRSKMS